MTIPVGDHGIATPQRGQRAEHVQLARQTLQSESTPVDQRRRGKGSAPRHPHQVVPTITYASPASVGKPPSQDSHLTPDVGEDRYGPLGGR
jgi:hypothetical protein